MVYPSAYVAPIDAPTVAANTSSTRLQQVTYRDAAPIESRITLRKLTSRDLDYFYLWASDKDVARTMTSNPYQSKREAEKFLKQVVDTHPWFKAICLDGVAIGSITLTQGTGSAACKAELGYTIGKPYWGRGIATVAVKQALRVGFKELHIQRIEAFVDPENIASVKVLTKSGLTREGLLKNYIIFKGQVQDRYVYSILAPSE